MTTLLSVLEQEVVENPTGWTPSSPYRVENGSVFEWDCAHDAFIFIGKLNGESFDEWIADYEQQVKER